MTKKKKVKGTFFSFITYSVKPFKKKELHSWHSDTKWRRSSRWLKHKTLKFIVRLFTKYLVVILILFFQQNRQLSLTVFLPRGRSGSVGRACNSLKGGPGFDSRCGHPLLGRYQYNVTSWDRSHGLLSLSRVWRHVNCQTLCLRARPRYSLVVGKDVKKPNKQTNKFSASVQSKTIIILSSAFPVIHLGMKQ